jgi:hypothetical protein
MAAPELPSVDTGLVATGTPLVLPSPTPVTPPVTAPARADRVYEVAVNAWLRDLGGRARGRRS